MRSLPPSLAVAGGLFVVMLFLACSEVTEPKAPEPVIEKILALGFDRSSIEEWGEYYVVEGDILFSKASLQRSQRDVTDSTTPPRSADGLRFQWATTVLAGQANVSDITFSVHDLESEWAEAAKSAAQAWNAIAGTKIYLVEGGIYSDIEMYMDNTLRDDEVAVATFPADSDPGEPGHLIFVNPYFNTLSFSQKKLNMVHEIGHTLGFRHTNWNTQTCNESEGTYGANQIGETPELDSYSVMNCATGDSSWVGFSYWDEESARVLYNAPLFLEISEAASGNVYLDWNAVAEAEAYIIWEGARYCNEYGCWTSQAAQDTITATSWEDSDTPYEGNYDCREHYYFVEVLFAGGVGYDPSDKATHPLCGG